MRTARQILADARTIAVVGASRDPLKPARWVPKMLQEQGWRIIPVNPHVDQVFGERAYARLADVPEHVDVVDVFRHHRLRRPHMAPRPVALLTAASWLAPTRRATRRSAETSGPKVTP